MRKCNLIQRSFADLRHSERAIALNSHLEALKRYGGQGKRSDLLDFLDDGTCGQVGHKLKSRDRIAERYALSEKTRISLKRTECSSAIYNW